MITKWVLLMRFDVEGQKRGVVYALACQGKIKFCRRIVQPERWSIMWPFLRCSNTNVMYFSLSFVTLNTKASHSSWSLPVSLLSFSLRNDPVSPNRTACNKKFYTFWFFCTQQVSLCIFTWKFKVEFAQCNWKLMLIEAYEKDYHEVLRKNKIIFLWWAK